MYRHVVSGFNTMTRPRFSSKLMPMHANATSCYIHLHPTPNGKWLAPDRMHVARGWRYWPSTLSMAMLICRFYGKSKTNSWSFAILEGFQSVCHVCVCRLCVGCQLAQLFALLPDLFWQFWGPFLGCHCMPGHLSVSKQETVEKLISEISGPLGQISIIED